VVWVGPYDGSNDGKAIHHVRHFGEKFADLDSWDLGRNRFELASDLGWGVHFQIEHILVRRPPREKDHNDRFV